MSAAKTISNLAWEGFATFLVRIFTSSNPPWTKPRHANEARRMMLTMQLKAVEAVAVEIVILLLAVKVVGIAVAVVVVVVLVVVVTGCGGSRSRGSSRTSGGRKGTRK